MRILVFVLFLAVLSFVTGINVYQDTVIRAQRKVILQLSTPTR